VTELIDDEPSTRRPTIRIVHGPLLGGFVESPLGEGPVADVALLRRAMRPVS
jgi:hypothetical protein